MLITLSTINIYFSKFFLISALGEGDFTLNKLNQLSREALALKKKNLWKLHLNMQ